MTNQPTDKLKPPTISQLQTKELNYTPNNNISPLNLRKPLPNKQTYHSTSKRFEHVRSLCYNTCMYLIHARDKFQCWHRFSQFSQFFSLLFQIFRNLNFNAQLIIKYDLTWHFPLYPLQMFNNNETSVCSSYITLSLKIKCSLYLISWFDRYYLKIIEYKCLVCKLN